MTYNVFGVILNLAQLQSKSQLNLGGMWSRCALQV